MNYGRSQIQVPPLTKVNKIIIISVVSTFLIQAVLKATLDINLGIYLGLSGMMVGKGFLHQIFTYSFVGTSLFEVLFDGLILWFIGADLESLWGARRYIYYLTSAALGGGVIFLLVQYLFFNGGPYFAFPLTGPGGICYALLMAYAILFPNRILYMIIFPIKAKWFCVILLGIQLYLGFFSGGKVLFWGHLGAMFSGFIFMIIVSNPEIKNYLSKKKKKLKKKDRSHLSLVKEDDDDDDSPKYWH